MLPQRWQDAGGMGEALKLLDLINALTVALPIIEQWWSSLWPIKASHGHKLLKLYRSGRRRTPRWSPWRTACTSSSHKNLGFPEPDDSHARCYTGR